MLENILVFSNKKYSIDVHVLYKDDDSSEEVYDLNLNKPILTYGEDERYYRKSLVSFKDLLLTSRISWGFISREDALKISRLYDGYYFKFLRADNINTLDDLVEDSNKKEKRM